MVKLNNDIIIYLYINYYEKRKLITFLKQRKIKLLVEWNGEYIYKFECGPI